ncbi:uncharacterized protein A1O9_08344 [Exophiala aquamarina CBS 119918]|uniref:Uncharacterized protein n=1 Tax=Exophiala aquamarina CBS 119918 TaxID=1182545 RepID=A0A072P648_9EURO|nr:uncharacterized protein A1O9_08344 [Exophiala aquamarina CBS 119918]KEF55594.1 hypothetical protein A1O9_08344 [Exophiala aquamarina CBS 119918]
MFLVGFEKLLKGPQLRTDERAFQITGTETNRSTLNELIRDDGVNYLDFFPGTTVETSKLFRTLLTENPPIIFMGAEWTNDLGLQLQDMFDQPYDNVDLDALLL